MYTEIERDTEIVQKLLIEHLGEIQPLSEEAETELIKALIAVEYPNGKNVRAALDAANISINKRQLKPYQDALIMARMGDKASNVEHIKAVARKNFYPGARVELL